MLAHCIIGGGGDGDGAAGGRGGSHGGGGTAGGSGGGSGMDGGGITFTSGFVHVVFGGCTRNATPYWAYPKLVRLRVMRRVLSTVKRQCRAVTGVPRKHRLEADESSGIPTNAKSVQGPFCASLYSSRTSAAPDRRYTPFHADTQPMPIVVGAGSDSVNIGVRAIATPGVRPHERLHMPEPCM